MQPKPFLLILFLYFCLNVNAQFAPPIKIPLEIAGSFGELRFNHYHTGLDFRTGNTIGIPVYATEDGWISKASIRSNGYGKCLYINHAFGYTTIYAHLSSFRKDIVKVCYREQVKKELNELEVYLNQDSFQVKKGDFIGFSGNTGASRAPHLHFEIIETLSHTAVNPFPFFADKLKDTISPVPLSILLSPHNQSSQLKINQNGRQKTINYPDSYKFFLIKKGRTYILPKNLSLNGMGRIELNIAAVDFAIDKFNFIQPYQTEVRKNNILVYRQSYDRIQTSHQRFINAHTLQKEFLKFNKWYERCYLLPNDSSGIVNYENDSGLLDLNASEATINLKIKDLANNISEVEFKIKNLNKKLDQSENLNLKDSFILVKYNKLCNLKSESIDLTINPYTVYNNLFLSIKKSKKEGYFTILDRFAPLQRPILIRYKIPNGSKTKGIGLMGERGFVSATVKDSFLFAHINYFGSFQIVNDTLPPKLKKIESITDDNNTFVTYYFKASDEMSGFKSVRVNLNNIFIPCEYDPKRKLITFSIKDGLLKEDHDLKVKVCDKAGNESEYLETLKTEAQKF